VVAPTSTPGITYLCYNYSKLAVKDTLVITVMKHVMDVYLNYVTVLMEFVILKTYAKQDGTDLSVTKVNV
jgi:hypothetical protein